MHNYFDAQLQLKSMIMIKEHLEVPANYEELRDGGNEVHSDVDIEDIQKHINLIQQSRIYEIDGRVARTFMLTFNKPRKIHMPFPVVFLTPSIEFNKSMVTGILIEYDNRYDDGDYLIRIVVKKMIKPLPKGMSVSQYFIKTKNNKKEKYELFRYNIWLNKDRKAITKKMNKDHGGDLDSVIKRTVMNFNDFLEYPEVKIIEKIPKNNDKRIKRGKLPMPKTNVISVKGELRLYINSIASQKDEDNNMANCYEVAGHWRTYRHPRYSAMQGERQFIHPYIKGSGLPDTRRRKVSNSKIPKNNLLLARQDRAKPQRKKKNKNKRNR